MRLGLRTLMLGLGIAVFAFLFISVMQAGAQGLLGGLFMLTFLGVAIIALLMALVFWKGFLTVGTELFNYWRTIIVKTAKLRRPPTLRSLYLTGTKEVQGRRLGYITGWTSAHFKDKKTGRKYDLSIFTFKQSPFPFSLFEQDKILIVPKEFHSDLIGDVYVYSPSIVPISRFGEVYTINTFEFKAIEYATMHSVLLEVTSLVNMIETLVKSAIFANPEVSKKVVSESLLEIPQKSFLEVSEERGGESK